MEIQFSCENIGSERMLNIHFEDSIKLMKINGGRNFGKNLTEVFK